ncbi:MAG: hypothetical protein RLZZ501_1657 [Pseudomonadota bacterium]|jgi:molybdopterin synthase sulfur carrier subunit
MTILYFSWVRDRIGLGRETAAPPPQLATLGQLRLWLAGLGPGHAAALSPGLPVRGAVNQELAAPDHPIGPDDEIAFFPLFSGG